MTEISQPSEHRTLEVLSALSYRTGELNPYLHTIAVSVSELIGVDWSVVTFCQHGSERIVASSMDLGEAADQLYSLHGSLTVTVLRTGQCVVVEDALACRDYGEPPEGYRAYLGVPLQTPVGEVIGTICSFHCQVRSFNAEEIQLVQIFAERAATAIDNYQLYQQQQAANQELKQINEQLQAEIRERQEMEVALRQSEEQLRQIAENLEQVFWMYSHDGQPIYISPAFEKVWGQTIENWYADPNFWWKVIHPEDRERAYNAYYHGDTLKFDEEYRVIHPDGSVRMIRAQAFPIYDEAGHIYRIAGISEDITERKQAEQDRLKAISSLAEVGELAAMIVHEIRNPLTTVMMGLNSFKRLDLPESFRERLALSLEEADRLRNLLSEILFYAKPQALQRAPVELNQFITEILESIRTMPLVMSRHIKFVPVPHAVT
ncbi:MAG: PAS domain-containing protein, partial [Leptolyngbyaceae bacterium]|nr:PAS domain-containing protein [Leptolyngbyaceae bacterium]